MAMTIRDLLTQAKEKLYSEETAELDSQLLLAHCLGVSRTYLYAHPLAVVDAEKEALFAKLLTRRQQKEPLAYIIGQRSFWSMDLQVTKATLIPRPETELLVEYVLTHIPSAATVSVADLGTGSGAIALALASERPHWHIHATDNSAEALAIAQDNAQRLGCAHISFHLGDWCNALPLQSFSAIISNPPYISETEWEVYGDNLAFEPKSALLSAENGLQDIRKICESAFSFLVPKGFLILEHGFQQGAAVRQIMQDNGYHSITTLYDLAGKERMTVGKI